MNYYHIIYTSSQKGLNGSNGYGIRTATVGTPKEYMQAVVTGAAAGKFNNVINNCNPPSIEEMLKDDGKAVHRVPPRYFLTKLEAAGGKTPYVLGRNVYLGFTETFYAKDKDGNISGAGGRPGNYLIDLYVFDELPPAQAFLLLYESPEQGLGRFVPMEAAPHKRNYEMADLAVGEPKELEVGDKSFNYPLPVSLSDKLADFLFAYVDAHLKGVQLMVKFPWMKTHQLLADALRLMPAEELKQLSFSTNYNGNGYQAPAGLLFANEYFKLDKAQYAGKGIFIDLESESPDTDESRAFGQRLRAAISSNELGKARKLVEWMLSDTYKYAKEKGLSPHTNDVLFCYSQTPDEFMLQMINEDAGHRDELVGALARYFAERPSNGNLFFELLLDKVRNASDISNIIACVKELEYCKGRQLPVDTIINGQMSHIEDVVMESADNAKAAIAALGLSTVRKYTHDLAKGRTWGELADHLLTIWKENKPTNLDDAAEKLQKALEENVPLYNLIIRNFSTLYDGVYQNVSQSLNSSSMQSVAASLKSKLIDPLHDELVNNSRFQDFNLLYEVASGNADIVSRSNYEKILPLVEKLQLAHSALGEAVKKCMLDSPTVADTVSKLRNIWDMKTADIIQAAGGNIRRKEYVKEALESEKEMELADVMKMLGEHNISNDILKETKRYASAYNAYCRKNAFGGFIKKLLSLFRGKPKEKAPKKPDDEEAETHSNNQAAPNSYLCSQLWERERPRPPKSAPHQLWERERPRPPKSAPHHNDGVAPAPVHKRILSELELKNVERLLKYPDMTVDDKVRDNANYIRDRYEEAMQKGGKVPKELERFSKYFSALLLLLLPFALDASAARQKTYRAYGDLPEAMDTCLVVNETPAKVRSSASFYRPGRKHTSKNERKDNVVADMPLQRGDTIFISNLCHIQHEEGVTWLAFSQNGIIYYTDMSKLVPAANSRYVAYMEPLGEVQSGGFIGWVQRAAPWALLILTIFFFAFSFAVWGENKESLTGEARSDTGMKPYFVFSLRPYKFFASLSGRILLAAVLSIIALLILGGIIWGVLWVVKIIMWIVIIVGWVLLVGGIIGCFANPIVGGIVAFLGYLIVHNDESISAFGNRCVQTGMEFFDAVNMWQFTLDLIKNYWVAGVTIALTPLVLFIVVAALIIAFAGILRGYEAVTTRRYNLKHPCPYCHEPSEPAIYYDGETEDGRLPVSLRPGIYGLFHITHPVTGTEMPTMLANGRDLYPRKCPHCGHFVNFEAGTEKHIGFVGMPDSGKTTLLCTVIGKMQKVYPELHFTDKVDDDVAENVKYANEKGHLDDRHLPFKTGREWKPSIQCILPRKNGGLPYHLYFNDVSGELFTSGGNDPRLLRFAQDVEDIIFIIDPWTIKLDKAKISGRMKKWLQRDDVALWQGGKQQEDITSASTSIVNILTNNKRNLAKIHFTFALAKSDTGYLEGIDTSCEHALRSFIEEDMHLSGLVYDIESQFQSVAYIATSVYVKGDPGVHRLCSALAARLQLE